MANGAGDMVRIAQLELRFMIEAPGATVFEFLVPAGARVPAPHFHRDVDELVYGLEGMLSVTVDGVATPLGPGQAIFIPRGAVHHHENRGAGPARALVSLTPGQIGRAYFAEVAAAVNGPGRPDPAQVEAIMLRHGLVPA